MNIFVSRDGQTFGPYPLDQVKQFLESGQLLGHDYALLEGQTEWKSLTEVVASVAVSSTPFSGAEHSVDSSPHAKKTSEVSQ